MHIKESIKIEEDEIITYKLSPEFLQDGKTLYSKIKNYMSSLEESESKKYFFEIKSNKMLNMLLVEKRLIDIS